MGVESHSSLAYSNEDRSKDLRGDDPSRFIDRLVVQGKSWAVSNDESLVTEVPAPEPDGRASNA